MDIPYVDSIMSMLLTRTERHIPLFSGCRVLAQILSWVISYKSIPGSTT